MGRPWLSLNFFPQQADGVDGDPDEDGGCGDAPASWSRSRGLRPSPFMFWIMVITSWVWERRIAIKPFIDSYDQRVVPTRRPELDDAGNDFAGVDAVQSAEEKAEQEGGEEEFAAGFGGWEWGGRGRQIDCRIGGGMTNVE